MKKWQIIGFVFFCIVLNQPALAQNNFSIKPVLPDSIVGKYMVYKSGSVTSFAQKTARLITYTDEFYVYSRKGTSGTSARASYNGLGVLTMSDKLSGEMLANLISKNRIYKRCRGDILKPPVDYAIQAIKDPKTGLFYTDRWTVKQKTKICDLVNVQHHSSDNRCVTNCVKYLKGYAPDFLDMRLYSSKNAALTDSRAR